MLFPPFGRGRRRFSVMGWGFQNCSVWDPPLAVGGTFDFLFTELQRTNNFPVRNEAGDVTEGVRKYCSFESLYLQYCFLSCLQIFVNSGIARGKISPGSGQNDDLIRAKGRKQRKLACNGQHKKPRRAEIVFLFRN